MRNDLVVSKSIDVNATPEKVWEALTNPEIIKEYLFGTETITDWKVGSEVIFQGAYEGHKYRDKGIVLENVPNQKLTYSYWSGFTGLADLPENYSTVHYTITPIDKDHTTFTWTQKGFANEEGKEHSESGMDAFIQKIKEIIER
ncbi:MAG: hypothetical protein JWO06_2870 [Bacteroidota bacterium]|nr:hypothetical protein [Bacteroidota bacterium]